MNLNFSSAKLINTIVHQVGNKSNLEGYNLSSSVASIEDDYNQSALVNYFLSPFVNKEYYQFWHESDINLNACYKYCKELFRSSGKFIEVSQKFAKHLYECSDHPNIRKGELYISMFQNFIVDDEEVKAIGIFKSESKDLFVQPYNSNNVFELNFQEGMSLKSIDKGCLIIQTTDGTLKLSIIDKTNKGVDARFWIDEFLRVIPYNDNFNKTNQILNITKNYITKQFAEEFNVNKTDQIDLLNRSIDYFKTHETFDKIDFQKEVFHHKEMIKSFEAYDENYRQNNEIEIDDNFEISNQAVKKQARVFKCVLKLDKNFHIYIHGDKELIEKGVEKDGRKYYKIYYEDES